MANSEQQHQLTSIKLVSECFVKPKYEVAAAKQPYHLGPADLIMLTIDPIQKGLLYTLDHTISSTNSDIVINHISRAIVVSHLVDKLKESLSIALVYFYPLAGRFTTQTYTDENACSIFVDCNKGPGARFIHATALDFKVSDILSPIDVTIVHPFFDLGEKYFNYDGLTRALLSIQVTELDDGVFIGFSINHSVVDGTSFIHFINMLSEIFRANDCSSGVNEGKMNIISRVPIMDYRPWLSSSQEMMIKFPVLDLEELMNRGYDHGPLRERIFQFSSSSMSKLKAKANEECRTHNLVSSFQALTALVWRSITRARNLPLDQTTSCFFVVGARSRFEQPISNDYFGSFLSKAQWDCKVEELLGNNLGWTAMNLREAISASNHGKKVIDLYKKLMNAPRVNPRGSSPNPLGESGVIMGGSARFELYGPEFGLGRALAARMGYGNKEDGKITASPGCEGGGSVDLEICLRPWVMDALNGDPEFMSFASFN